MDDITSFMIPLLLDKGLLAPSAEGKGFSIGLLLRIVKTSRSSLKDHLIRLISVLVESMSAMEPRSLQYMEFHTERLNISATELESTRLKLSQLSPLQEALDICLESLQNISSKGIITEIIINLCMQTQQGVGLATRVTAIRSLNYIMTTYPDGWTSISVIRCFHSLMTSIIPTPPSSLSLRKDIILSIGAISKMCESTFLGNEITKLILVYQNQRNEDQTLTITISETIHQIINKSGECLQEEPNMWKSLLRCTYIGSFEEDNEVQLSWSSLYADVILQSGYGTRESSIRAIFSEILQDISTLLSSLSWKKRNQALLALNDIISIFPSGILAPNTTGIMISLFRVIPGQMWKGKEFALRTISLLLEKCPQCINENESIKNLFTIIVPDFQIQSQTRNITIIELEDLTSKSGLIEKIQERFIQLEFQLQSIEKNNKYLCNKMDIGEGIIMPSNLGWRVSWSAILEFYLSESLKGDRQYKLIAATSLSCLPWISMNSHIAIQIILSKLEILCQRAGIDPNESMEQQQQQQGLEDDNDITNNNNNKQREIEQQRKFQVDMFGGRYGEQFQQKKKRLKEFHINSTEDISDTPNNNKLEDLNEKYEIHENDESIESKNVNEEEKISINQETKEVENSFQNNSQNQNQIQPKGETIASRLKYLECILTILTINYDLINSHFNQLNLKWDNFVQFIQYLLITINQKSLFEVWSIRKCYLLIIIRVIHIIKTFNYSEIEMIIFIAESNLNDKKYLQIREISSEVILKLLLKINSIENIKESHVLNIDLKNKINKVIVNLSLETSDKIINFYYQIKEVWNQINKRLI